MSTRDSASPWPEGDAREQRPARTADQRTPGSNPLAPDIAANPYKQDFPLLAANPGLAFLDSAATAQRPAVALDAQRDFYEKMNANALRGLYRLSVDATEAIDEARAHVARFIGARSCSAATPARP